MPPSNMFIVLCLYLVFITIQQNCKQGETYGSTGLPNNPNGCGGAQWQVSLGWAILPYDGLMTPCCNQHDICYNQCDPINSLRHKFNECNQLFKECNQQKCQTLNNIFSRTRCSASASFMYTVVNDFGWSHFLSNQAKFCVCSS